MKKRFLSLIIVLIMFVGVFSFSGCKPKEKKNGKDFMGYKVEYVGDDYVYLAGKLLATYSGKNLSLTKEDFKVTELLYDGTEKVLKETELENVEMTSSIADSTITNAGEYTLVFKYKELVTNLNVLVEKATIAYPYEGWNYSPGSPSYQYTGSEKRVELFGLDKAIKQVIYTNNTATEVGEYTATATFIVSSNYKEIPPVTLNWEIT